MKSGAITAVTASSMFSALTNSDNDISITIAGQTRTLTPAYATTAGSVANALALTIKSGTTEGTDLYTFDGSEAKSLNIVAGSNVTLTATAGQLTIASTNTNTLNTAGSNQSTSKLYLVGATSQASSATTYSNSSVYASAGYLYSGGTKVSVEGHTHTVSSITDLGSIATKSADDYAGGVTWDTVTTVGSWSRICKIDGYGNIILAIRFSQNSQASMNTYQVNTAYGYAVITQIGYNNYNSNYAVQLRVTQSGSTHANFYVEVYNSYGYNSATTVTYTTRATILGPWCTFTPITTYTAGGDNVRSSLTSSYWYAANFVAQSADGANRATLLAPISATANKSTWNPQSFSYEAWGQCFSNSSISSDAGDITMWLRSSQYMSGGTELCVCIDGDYYAGTGKYKVLHEGNYDSYALPLSGGTITGDLLIPLTKQTSASYGVPAAGTMPQSAAFNDVANYKTFLGSFYHTTYSWYNIISIRHRNGASDGGNYGMRICGPMVSEGSLTYEQQIGGTWRSTRTLLDSKNYSSYALPITGGTVSGSITATGEITAGSDMRYKTPIAPITAIAPEKISKAPLFTFTWKNRDDTAIHLGSSAQYWQEIFPELVTGTDFLTLNYGALGTALGILNSRRIDTAEQRIAKLERENKKLKKEIKILKAERL
jgi:hypothetical protein